MAAARSNHRETTLVLTDSASGELVARRWRVESLSVPEIAIERAGGTVVVGSHRDADLRIDDPSVSRYHAELRLLAEGVVVVDLGSSNGTRVGGAKIQSALVGPRERFRVGRHELQCVPLDKNLETQTQPETHVDQFGDFVSCAQKCRQLLGQLRLVAKTDATVLLQGETGTGKELLARALHAESARAGESFVVVDCGAVTESLLESQLFGHEKGAFTGATETKTGAFEAANGGTVVLDELGELPLALQPKLLRVLEARTVQRLGSVEERPVDVRFVASTHRDLDQMVRDGTFREDLFYRVAVVRAKVPPLRQRLEDVPVLAARLAEALSPGVTLSERSMTVLQGYDWPGNARQLRNVIERAVVVTRDRLIEPEHLFPADGSAQDSFHDRKDQLVATFEKRYVAALLARHNGNVSKAAREAGLSRNALYALVKRVEES